MKVEEIEKLAFQKIVAEVVAQLRPEDARGFLARAFEQVIGGYAFEQALLATVCKLAERYADKYLAEPETQTRIKVATAAGLNRFLAELEPALVEALRRAVRGGSNRYADESLLRESWPERQ